LHKRRLNLYAKGQIQQLVNMNREMSTKPERRACEKAIFTWKSEDTSAKLFFSVLQFLWFHAQRLVT
jgi:hypothetical protein